MSLSQSDSPTTTNSQPNAAAMIAPEASSGTSASAEAMKPLPLIVNGVDLASDPAQLEPQTRTNFILAVREKVARNEEVPNEEIAFALRCVRLSRAEASRSRTSSGGEKAVKVPEKAVALSDF